MDREEEIRRFVPQEYFTVQAKCRGFTATWRDRNGQTRTFDRERAEHLCAALQGKHGVLSEVKRTLRQAPPPAAYDLTELQRDANRKYAYSAKETLSLMQSLYERHKLLTYPRDVYKRQRLKLPKKQQKAAGDQKGDQSKEEQIAPEGKQTAADTNAHFSTAL